jgi:hypothetical protein
VYGVHVGTEIVFNWVILRVSILVYDILDCNICPRSGRCCRIQSPAREDAADAIVCILSRYSRVVVLREVMHKHASCKRTSSDKRHGVGARAWIRS